jgi:hypothetical protein
MLKKKIWANFPRIIELFTQKKIVTKLSKIWVWDSGSVADPGCLSRIPDPDFYPSRISDTESKNSNKREGSKNICCHNILCSNKFHKIANYFSFGVLKKKLWANFQRIIKKYGFGIRDPRFGIRKNLFRIPDPGV